MLVNAASLVCTPITCDPLTLDDNISIQQYVVIVVVNFICVWEHAVVSPCLLAAFPLLIHLEDDILMVRSTIVAIAVVTSIAIATSVAIVTSVAVAIVTVVISVVTSVAVVTVVISVVSIPHWSSLALFISCCPSRSIRRFSSLSLNPTESV